MTISRYGMRNVSDKSCRENQNTHFCSNLFSAKSCRLRDNVEKYCRARQATDDNKIRRMRIVCWIPKATNTHSEYVTLIAFPHQQWLHELASVLRYTYIGCLVTFEKGLKMISVGRNMLQNKKS